jgi:lysozyme
MRPVPAVCIDFVKEFEGLELVGKHDPADAPNIITIGYGHTADEGAPIPTIGMKLTAAEAEQILAADLARHAAVVEKLVTVPINDNMFAALVSFAFNEGDENLRRSTLFARINASRFQDAIPEFRKWVYSDGKERVGLFRRRISEANLFCGFPNPIVQHVDLPKFRRSRAPFSRD